MFPILTGTEVLIPFSKGYKSDSESDDDVDVVKPRPVDFWGSIHKINWMDKDDIIAPQANIQRISEKLQRAEWQFLMVAILQYVERMSKYLDEQKFCDITGITEEDCEKIIWHIIARGKITYEAVLNDYTFAIAFIGQECGFKDVIHTW